MLKRIFIPGSWAALLAGCLVLAAAGPTPLAADPVDANLLDVELVSCDGSGFPFIYVTVNVTDGTKFSSIEVKCQSSGYRNRGNFSGSTAVVPNVPTNEKCDIFFKGGPLGKAAARGGQTISCSFNGGQANCR